MNEWVAPVVGVAGTLAGTALGGYLGALNERARWRREQSARWVDQRRSLYAGVVSACEYVVDEITFGKPLEGRTFGEIIEDLRPVRERLRPLIADLELIGTDQDAAAARDLYATAESVMDDALRNPDGPAKPSIDRWTNALATFKQIARAGLHPE